MSVLSKGRQKGGVKSKHLSCCWQRGFWVGFPLKEVGATCWKRKWVDAAVHFVGKCRARNNTRILICYLSFV